MPSAVQRDQVFVKAPAAWPVRFLRFLPCNFVPDAAALGQGALQCNECPTAWWQDLAIGNAGSSIAPMA